jgi:hypothetical protein
LDDVEAGIDVIGRLFTKYSVVLTASTEQLTPVIPYDWEAIFRVPWLNQ